MDQKITISPRAIPVFLVTPTGGDDGLDGTASDSTTPLPVVVVNATGSDLRTTADITIASGQSLSSAFDCGESLSLDSIINPASVGTTTVLTFAFSHTLAGTYAPLKDEFGQEVRLNNITALGGRNMPKELYGKRFLKLRRGTEAAPNTEAAAHIYKAGFAP